MDGVFNCVADDNATQGPSLWDASRAINVSSLESPILDARVFEGAPGSAGEGSRRLTCGSNRNRELGGLFGPFEKLEA